MFLILCFIDKKIFVYSEIEIKSNVDKENETSKTNSVCAYFKFMIKTKLERQKLTF